MQQPTRNIPPPPRPHIAPTLRKLRPGESILFESGAATVHSIIWRVKQEFAGREYTAAQVDGGIRVWRLK